MRDHGKMLLPCAAWHLQLETTFDGLMVRLLDLTGGLVAHLNELASDTVNPAAASCRQCWARLPTCAARCAPPRSRATSSLAQAPPFLRLAGPVASPPCRCVPKFARKEGGGDKERARARE